MKFEIGDIVAAKKESNDIYCQTTELNKWIGVVTSANEICFTAKTIYSTIKAKGKFDLDYSFFDLIKRFEKVKMTHEDIVKALGYDFELVGEK